MKRALAAFCVALLLAGFCFGAALCEENLLSNGSFEITTASGTPEDWYPTAYRNQPGYSRMAVTDEKAYSGQYSVVVENASSNDARFIHTVKVEPESMYKLSGYVLVETMEDTGNGANFGIEGIYAFSEGIFDTNGNWQYLEWYGETGEDQHEVTIGIRVGGYSAESVGKAYFDDIALEKVEQLPHNVFASLWYNENDYYASDTHTDNHAGKNTAAFVVLGVFFLCFTVLCLPALEKNKDLPHSHYAFALIALISLALRILLGIHVEGYEVDINCYTAWSLRMASVGPAGFYAPDYFCDYPPGAMLLLWPVGLLLNGAGTGSPAALLVVKALPILCDMLGAFVLYVFAYKTTNSRVACAAAALYLMNPAVLVNGAAWGQMDSVLALLILLTALAAMKHQWNVAIPMFVVSVLVKPQALLFAPIGGMALLYHYFSSGREQKKQILKQTGTGICFALFAALVIVVPFAVSHEKPFSWLIELYGNTLGSYAYATLNTANLYYLAGANWTPLSQEPPALMLILPAVLFAGSASALFWKKAQKHICCHHHKAQIIACLFTVMAVIELMMLVLGADYQWYGYAMMALAYVLAIICLAYEQKPGALAYCMAMALIGVYVLGIKVHERYLYPALVLLLVSYLASGDRRILGLFAGFSFTTFINTAIVLDNSILFGAAQGHLNADTQNLNLFLCVVNLLLCGYSAWIGICGLRRSRELPQLFSNKIVQSPEKTSSFQQMLVSPGDHRLHLTGRDYLLMGITTVAYAVVAFANLGSTEAPQTAWVSTSADEYVVFELDQPHTFSMMYYGGVSYNDFSISVSEDGVLWSDEYPCEMREGLCYRWNYALKATKTDNGVTYPTCNPGNVLWLEGKYLRVNARTAGLNLWEVVAKDENGEILPLRLKEHANGRSQLLDDTKSAANLIDEQMSCTGEPSWYTGMYFDEIYHARTAYEHLHGQVPYETTHPPLGKLLMSVGIAIFGMTPFGWRFAGTLIGVLMLPAIYLFALQLSHKRRIAGISMLAFALDLMHYTQTRIATIDSFPVFFILLTYLFMVRYMQMDSFAVTEPKRPYLFDKAYLKTLVPLFWCGVFMGVSIACKWIGIYSAVGLAVLFFLAIYRQIRVYNMAWKAEDIADNPRVRAARELTVHRIAVTCGFCVLFFILIPCVIYGASYIPYLSPNGPVTLKRIIQAQQGMLSYHSTPGLGMDHPFQSPWWQWPFIMKPMWFAQDQFEPAGYASTILCFGNPWVFYIGAFAMIGILVGCIGKAFRWQNGQIVLGKRDGDLTYVILTIGFLAQYLPWVLVPRSMYMYHYFASVPFIVIATAVLLDRLFRRNAAVQKTVIFAYLLGALVFFVMFFPYASGCMVSTEWLDAMKWFLKLYY